MQVLFMSCSIFQVGIVHIIDLMDTEISFILFYPFVCKSIKRHLNIFFFIFKFKILKYRLNFQRNKYVAQVRYNTNTIKVDKIY